MKRLDGGYLGARPPWSYSARTGAWNVEHAYAKTVDGLWPGVNPILGLSPVLWYDFSDTATVTVSSSQITQITDKGSRGWTLTKSTTGPAVGTWSNGLQCSDWGNAGHGNYLRNATSTSTSLTEAYVVLDANYDTGYLGGTVFVDYYTLMSGTTSGGFSISGWANRTGFYPRGVTSNFDAAYLNNGVSGDYTSGLLPGINSRSLIRFLSTGSTLVTTTGFQIGSDRASGGYGWGGLVGEIVIFQTALSSTNRTNVQNYLAAKWSLTLS